MGVPKTAADYKLPRPEKLVDGMVYDENLEKGMREVFHKAAISEKQAACLAENFNRLQEAIFTEQQKAAEAQLDKDIAELHNSPEWKGDELRASNVAVLTALDKFGGPDLKKLLADQKIADGEKIDDGKLWAQLGFDPSQRRIWRRIAKELKLDTIPKGEGPGVKEAGGKPGRYNHPDSKKLFKGSS